MLVSQAVVTIDRPARWAKQLADHFSHKIEVEDVPGGRLVHFEAGDGLIASTEWALLMNARAETEEQVAQVQGVLARHLERFAHNEGVEIVWTESAPVDLPA